MQQNNERKVAARVLHEVIENKAYTNITLRKVFAESNLDSRAKAFVTDMVNETMRNLLHIDHVLNSFSKTPVAKMKPFIRNLLRISVCQLLYMEEIPPHAAINEAVRLTKQVGLVGLSGFVNGVLRNISRANMHQTSDFAIKYSYPTWLWEKLVYWLGQKEAEAFAITSHSPPSVSVCVNTYKTTVEDLQKLLEAEGVTSEELETKPFLVLKKPGDISRLASFKKGMFFVMDSGAYSAIIELDPKPGQTIIDMCAAPGGKSFATAVKMENRGQVLSFDLHKHKVELLKQGALRLGLSCISPAMQDSSVLNPKLENLADAVLLDAPCSGFGTIRKHPEMKYSRTMKDVLELAKIQNELINTAAKYVKPGGKLVYCTCTVTKEENQHVVEKFLKQNENFKLKSSKQLLPMSDSDAFFVASFIKVI